MSQTPPVGVTRVGLAAASSLSEGEEADRDYPQLRRKFLGLAEQSPGSGASEMLKSRQAYFRAHISEPKVAA
jgi:hypothetical protein